MRRPIFSLNWRLDITAENTIKVRTVIGMFPKMQVCCSVMTCNFMSCNFMFYNFEPCYLVLHVYVLYSSASIGFISATQQSILHRTPMLYKRGRMSPATVKTNFSEFEMSHDRLLRYFGITLSRCKYYSQPSIVLQLSQLTIKQQAQFHT